VARNAISLEGIGDSFYAFRQSVKRPLQVGVIGVGHLGRHHARIYAELSACKLVGVVDIDKVRATEIGQIYKVRAYQDYRDLFGQVDAVSIAVPTVKHYEIGMDCLRAGIHVLMEKPIAKTLPEASELVHQATVKGLVLQVGHLERFNPAVQALNRLAHHPGFIESYRIGGFSDRSTDIDVIMDLMIHDIDIILNLVPSPIRQIQAVGVPVLTSRIDIANARIQFESGCVANMTASRVSLKQERKLRVFQKEQYLSLDYQAQELTVAKLEYSQGSSDREKPPSERPEIIVKKVDVAKGEPLKMELESFVDCILHKKKPQVSGEAGLRALEVAVEILENMNSV